METELDGYHEAIRLSGVAIDRAMAPAKEPFLIESFCTQVAWMGKLCPVYPATSGRPEETCKFLTQDGYEDYRCPAYADPSVIYKPIFESGTPEQREALEQLADFSIRYSQAPINDDTAFWLENTRYRCLGDAIRIYEGLGLAEKADAAKRVWRKITTKKLSDPKKAKASFEKWEREQAEIDKEAIPKLDEFFRKLSKRQE